MVYKSLDFGGSQRFWDKGNSDLQEWRKEIDLHLEVSYTNNQLRKRLWQRNSRNF